MLARDQYVRDHLTDTYLKLLQAVAIRQLMAEEAFRLPQGQQPSVQPPADRATEPQTLFTASLLAFGSQEVYDLWVALDARWIELVGVLNGLRLLHSTAPEQIPAAKQIPGVQQADANWVKAHSDLVNRVRDELEFKNRMRLLSAPGQQRHGKDHPA